MKIKLTPTSDKRANKWRPLHCEWIVGDAATCARLRTVKLNFYNNNNNKIRMHYSISIFTPTSMEAECARLYCFLFYAFNENNNNLLKLFRDKLLTLQTSGMEWSDTPTRTIASMPVAGHTTASIYLWVMLQPRALRTPARIKCHRPRSFCKQWI